MWRPKEGWEKERDQWLNIVGGKFADSGEVMEASVIYEAGADALLKGLRADGFHIMAGQILKIEGKKIKATKNQTLVLIPDDG